MSHSGAASYKKVNGILTIDEDQSPAELLWRSTDGDKQHKIVLDVIDKLQATPASSEKLMLRLIEKVNEDKKMKNSDGEMVPVKPASHMFSFNNRDVMDNIKITLQQIISRYKDTEVNEEKRKIEGNPLDHSQQAQQLELINTNRLDDSLSSENLLKNLKLQQSLLTTNKQLMRTFQETVINSQLPPDEFWSTRIPMLRAFALSTSQKIGPYNVLSTIKPVASSENQVNVNLSRDKIMSIFQNYPIAKKAYIDNVPKNFKESEFWARFFSSKLFRKLRGEKIMSNDRGDVIIDRYLTLDQEYDRKDDERLLHPVSKFIDLDGNLQDDPVKKGNRKDFTMQPSRDINGHHDGSTDILKGMNRLSEKMTTALENEYSRSNLTNQNDAEAELEQELEINDLNDEYKAEYSLVHLKLGTKTREKNPENIIASQQSEHIKITDPIVKSQIYNVKASLINKLDLTDVISGKGSDGENIVHEINQKVLKTVRINAKQAKHNNMDSSYMAAFTSNGGNEKDATTEVPIDLLESCRMLHSTCCEFLKHFYIHFQSGDQRQAGNVKKLYGHLKDCVEKLKELLKDVKQGDGEKLANLCEAYLGTTMRSIELAINKYDSCK
ncbi:General transcription and DNA repair factor IIH subunit TFB1 [Nakaseomyces bracarensis]|uniref:General transcription and DNA repair factor IIH subunit TFB1 n=1 Tax=Nakaseomyces bracarensis TaxID=273131 RepID=A0ABR4NZW5_9SACH